MCVGDLCRRKVITTTPEVSLCDAAQLMRERHVGLLVVVAAESPPAARVVQGVLTDRDIVITVVGHGADPRDLKVGDVMTRHPLLVAELQPVDVVLRLMRDEGIRRVPVVGSHNELVGILSIDDVLERMAEQLACISGAIRGEQGRERITRA